MIDLKCATCDRIQPDHLERDEDKSRPDCCGAPMERVFLPTARGNVIGDECDIWVKNGLCNSDNTPRHFTSKEALRKAADKAGMTNYVEHKGSKGGDRSKHTVRWT
jgi:hypothetical protein